ncbi:hypothetical protein [Mycolicibacterium sphagni]|uniref:DUF222 domain-containing protein n=1 Tax=Mycolicibacterium sphagni TaxID=1786 RepID=A0ABX2JPM2_9MYCO|nr:hypothetical protein [Mycolicibacterium sphagni]NTY58729.1 hypothetical protein [Mycolicibacterium sphagni]
MSSAEEIEYDVRAGMYRLLAAFPTQGATFTAALDQALADPRLRDIVSALVGTAFGGYIKITGDVPGAIDLIERELRTAEELAALGNAEDPS